MVHTHTEYGLSARGFQLDIGESLGICSAANCMLTIGNKAVVGDADAADGVKECIDGPVSCGRKEMILVAETQIALKMHNGRLVFLCIFFIELIAFEIIGRFDFQIIGAENIEDFFCFQLTPGFIAGGLYKSAEFGMHGLGKFIAEGLLHNKGGSAGSIGR